MKSSRQFIHSEDVREFSNFILAERITPGIVHLPNLLSITFLQLFKELYQMLGFESLFINPGVLEKFKKIFTQDTSTKHFIYGNSEKGIAKGLFEYSKEFSANYLLGKINY